MAARSAASHSLLVSGPPITAFPIPPAAAAAPYGGASGFAASQSASVTLTAIAPSTLPASSTAGYVEVGADGAVFAYGTPYLGGANTVPGGPGTPIVGVAATAGGYVEVGAVGAVFAYGTPVAGGANTVPGGSGTPIVGVAAATS